MSKPRKPRSGRLPAIWMALASISLACALLQPLTGTPPPPTASATLVRRSTITPTGSPTRTLSPTSTLTPTFTPSPSATWTPTPSPTFTPRPTRTRTPTRTAVPPTFTPGPDQITRDYDAWQLTAIELRPKASFLGTLITPQQYNQAPGGYQFLVMDFECLTGPSLIALFDLKEYGLVFVHRKDGYPDIWLQDQDANIYPVNMIATCWLASVVPPGVQSVTLFYNGFIFHPTLPVLEGT